jgi:hypothetical protein
MERCAILRGTKSPFAPFGKGGWGDFESDLIGIPFALVLKTMKAIQKLFLQSNCWNSQDGSHAALQVDDGYAIETQILDGKLVKGEHHAECRTQIRHDDPADPCHAQGHG